jgi:putative sterol carrier protein
MAERKSTKARSAPKLESTIASLAGRVSDKAPKSAGPIVLRASDTDEEFSVQGIGPRAKVSKGAPAGEPAVTVRGPASVLQSILDGEMEASRAFARGEIRVRGNLPYLEGVLKDLGLLECE